MGEGGAATPSLLRCTLPVPPTRASLSLPSATQLTAPAGGRRWLGTVSDLNVSTNLGGGGGNSFMTQRRSAATPREQGDPCQLGGASLPSALGAPALPQGLNPAAGRVGHPRTQRASRRNFRMK